MCTIMSILTHFFFVATFMFMFLESLHTYSLVAYVVKKNGILNRLQNTLIGWGFALAITCASVGLCFDDYGGPYHCWLQIGNNKNFVKSKTWITGPNFFPSIWYCVIFSYRYQVGFCSIDSSYCFGDFNFDIDWGSWSCIL